jgi:hypothetical protein
VDVVVRIAGVATGVVVAAVSAAGAAEAEPQTIFNTTSGATQILDVGVDIAPGLWVGTPLVDYPGTCSMIVWRSYPPQSTDAGIEGWPVSNSGQPLTYRITSGGTVKLSRDCAWARLAA